MKLFLQKIESHIKNQQIPGSPAWNLSHNYFGFIFTTKRMKVKGGTLSSNSCGNGTRYKVCTDVPDKSHESLISKGYISLWSLQQYNIPWIHKMRREWPLFPTWFPQSALASCLHLWLSTHLHLKRPHMLSANPCHLQEGTAPPQVPCEAINPGRGRNHKNFYLCLFSLQE